MYGNFIYFILVLLIYSTYYPPETSYLQPFETLVALLASMSLFAILTRSAFQSLARKVREGARGLHGTYDRLFSRQAVMAIGLFALYVYVLNLKRLVMVVPLFAASPTLSAFFFIALFMAHLVIIWWTAYDAYKILFLSEVSKWNYVLSNVAFNFPVILPWLLISAGLDIVNVLPFETPKHLLATPEGQLAFFSLFLAALIVVAPSLIKVFWQCRPLPPGPSRHRIEAICRKTRLGYNNILNWTIFEGKLLTAGVMGLIKPFRYILVSEGLLQILNDEELDAVMAHEIGHIKKKHLLFYLFFFLGFIVLSYAAFDLILYAVLYGKLFLPIPRNPSAEPFTMTSILLTAAMAFVFLIYFRFIFGYFMRNCERQADLYAFTLLGTARGLVSSLNKIAYYSGQSHDRPSWHHFSIRQRVDFLLRCEDNASWVARHDRKLIASMAAFFVGLIGMAYLGYGINFGEMGKTLNRHFIERALAEEIERHPGSAPLHSMLASLYYQTGEFEAAIAGYERAIELDPLDAEALNNLAWIYATCEKAELRNPARALSYAEQAAALKPSTHVLDTLAESYYVNGMHVKAIDAIKKALAMNPEDRPYYQGQLKKFEQARQKIEGLRN